jgi:hypothetical protein
MIPVPALMELRHLVRCSDAPAVSWLQGAAPGATRGWEGRAAKVTGRTTPATRVTARSTTT